MEKTFVHDAIVGFFLSKQSSFIQKLCNVWHCRFSYQNLVLSLRFEDSESAEALNNQAYLFEFSGIDCAVKLDSPDFSALLHAGTATPTQLEAPSFNKEVETWLQAAKQPVKWFVSDEEIMVICKDAYDAEELWQALDWSQKKPRVAGRQVCIWAANRLYAATSKIRPW